MWKITEKRIEKNEWWMLAALGAIFMKIPSLLEPYWYGDEGIYLTIGRAMNMGVKLYSQIHDNKPPLLYLMASLAGGTQFWMKLEALAASTATIFVFGKLAEKVFGKETSAKHAAIWAMAILTCLPFWEGNIANAENFFLLPTVIAAWLLWDAKKLKTIFLAGLALGIGGLFKMPALLEAGVWPLLWLREGSGWGKKTLMLGAGVLLPVIVSVGYFYAQGSGPDYIKAAWSQNIPYLSSWKPSSSQTGIYSLTTRAGIAAVAAAILIGLENTLGRRAAAIGLWGVVALFAALLSGRPYPHYLLQTAGAFSLAIGLLRQEKLKETVVTAGLLSLLALSWIGFRFYAYPVAGYYTNFIKWAWGKETTEEYRGYFGQDMDELYQVAENIKSLSHKDDRIFVWGDVPMIYALSERIPATKYMVEYHIKDFKGEKLTISQLKEKPPVFIVAANKESLLPEIQAMLDDDYYKEMKTNKFDVYKLGKL